MNKTKGKPFNQNEYIYEWGKSNLKQISAKYKVEFVEEFNDACKQLGLVKSQVFKEAMEKVIQKAKKEQKNKR